MHPRIRPQQFPLASSSWRVALLTGVLAGTVQPQEIQHHLALDVEPRPRQKPVMVWNQRFPSIQAAAEWCQRQPWGRRRSLASLRHEIRRACDQDCWENYYWTT